MHYRHHTTIGDIAKCGLVALGLLALGCVSSGHRVATRPDLRPAESGLVFENGTTESAAIYLADDVGEWLVGHVEPGRTVILRMPVAASARRGREFSILVVRAGGRRHQPGLGNARPTVTRSDKILGERITAIRWRLAERQLIATPLPKLTHVPSAACCRRNVPNS
jgi:hypothetical protein